MSATLEKYQLGFPALAVITSDAQNKSYVKALLEIERLDRPTGEQRDYANVLAALIEKYERDRFPDADALPVAVLSELIDANNLRQKDLASIFGGESAVPEVLSGKRELNRRHIEKLSKRFAVSPAVFFPRRLKSAAR
jgi:HTH-type transcriptional regulator / antitoxin HigA